MLKIKVKEDENIDRALKRYKRKYKRTNVLGEIRERMHFTKQSEQKRETIKKAEYSQQYIEEHSE
ncbi:hypothetical protein MTsPCn9_08890 [Croceitalea sp. MTPC9]|uniref:30S ribosomal protein S21 n=1 Tax=unclassified Croceitalea TaxID=2632280 RepID=UPI002B3AE84F|nr:hypothetical protein MTsPCn6_34100 [Croceitalea sp. MTPC6]GMN15953.1 hypothetical protein MTsPCn9_08890 [Croceitalea sp. MTPC9]